MKKQSNLVVAFDVTPIVALPFNAYDRVPTSQAALPIFSIIAYLPLFFKIHVTHLSRKRTPETAFVREAHYSASRNVTRSTTSPRPG